MGRKTTVGAFQATNNWENIEMAKKEKPLERNSISSNRSTKQPHNDYVKTRLDKSQQNSSCRLCDDRSETIDHIINECGNLTQREYKTRHEWAQKEIYSELCKKIKFDHTNKWYMHNPESVLENERHKLLWDFEIQTDHLISAMRPDLVIVPVDHKVKLNESEKRDKNLDLAKELKRTMEHESGCDTNRNWHARYSHQMIGRGTGVFGNKRSSEDHPNYSIVEIVQNTEKSPELEEIAVTHTQLRNHQLTPMWKNQKQQNNKSNNYYTQ